MSYDVRAEPEVAGDLAELAEQDARIVEAAVESMLELRTNPWLGDDL